MLVGQGARGCVAELTEVADLLGAGAAKALLGKDVLPDDLPWVTGSIGLLGTIPSYKMMMGCDTLLTVGSNFPYTQFMPKLDQARAVQIDRSGKWIGMRYPYELNLVGDAQTTLQALIPLLERKADRAGARRSRRTSRDWWQTVERRAHDRRRPGQPDADLLRAVRAAARRTRSSPPTPAARPTGTPGTCASPATCAARCPGRWRRWDPGVPYAIGAKWAHPDRPAIAFVGDGAMQMNGMAELITVAHYWQQWADPRLIVAVLHNNDLNQVTWEMRAMEGSPKFAESQTLPDVDYAAFARSLGLDGVNIDDRDAARRRRGTQALAADRPSVLDVRCDPNVPPIPPHATFEQVESTGRCGPARRRGHLGLRQAGTEAEGAAVPARAQGRRMTEIRCPQPVLRSTPPRRTSSPWSERWPSGSTARCASTRARRARVLTDASNFRQVPIGVVVPRTIEAAVEAIAVCREHGAPVRVPRRRHQPGRAVHQHRGDDRLGEVLQPAGLGRRRGADLRRRAGHRARRAQRSSSSEHGLRYGPEPATHPNCTLGGMIGNNSCGATAQRTGKVVDNIARLEVLLYDGTRFWCGETSDDEYDAIERARRPAGRRVPAAARRCATPTPTRSAPRYPGHPAPGVRLQPRLAAARARLRRRRAAGRQRVDAGHRAARRARTRPRREGNARWSCSAIDDDHDGGRRRAGDPAARADRAGGPRPPADPRPADQGPEPRRARRAARGRRLPDGAVRRRHPGRGRRAAHAHARRARRDRRTTRRVTFSTTRAWRTSCGRCARPASAPPRTCPDEPDTWEGWEDSAVPPERLGRLPARPGEALRASSATPTIRRRRSTATSARAACTPGSRSS